MFTFISLAEDYLKSEILVSEEKEKRRIISLNSISVFLLSQANIINYFLVPFCKFPVLYT